MIGVCDVAVSEHLGEFQEDCPFGRSFSVVIRVFPGAPNFEDRAVTVGTDKGEGGLQGGADDL